MKFFIIFPSIILVLIASCKENKDKKSAEMNKTNNVQDTLKSLPEITKEIPKGFIREYAADSLEIYDSKSENINGCKKVVEWKAYNKNFELQEEWEKKYRTDSTQTCDFSAYIVYKKKYKKDKLEMESIYFAGSDQSEDEPCGTWKYYDEKGNVIKAVKYEKCDISRFGKN